MRTSPLYRRSRRSWTLFKYSPQCESSVINFAEVCQSSGGKCAFELRFGLKLAHLLDWRQNEVGCPVKRRKPVLVALPLATLDDLEVRVLERFHPSSNFVR